MRLKYTDKKLPRRTSKNERGSRTAIKIKKLIPKLITRKKQAKQRKLTKRRNEETNKQN
jgi:hypothetical protein